MTEPQTVLELHLKVDQADHKAVDLLANRSKLSRGQVKSAMKNGAVWLEHNGHVQRLRRAERRPKQGDVIHLYFNAQIQRIKPPDAELLADAGNYSVWFKPAGMYSQGSKWGDHCSLGRWAEHHLKPQRNAFIVHRLDRAASGLMLLAHSKEAARRLSALFHQRQISKRYCVAVWGEFPEKPVDLNEPLDGLQAMSRAERIAYTVETNQSVLGVRIETGRKHQIRRHLANHGFPVVGDRLYGKGDDATDLQLQAVHIAFTCPFSGEARKYTLPEKLLINQECKTLHPLIG